MARRTLPFLALLLAGTFLQAQAWEFDLTHRTRVMPANATFPEKNFTAWGLSIAKEVSEPGASLQAEWVFGFMAPAMETQRYSNGSPDPLFLDEQTHRPMSSLFTGLRWGSSGTLFFKAGLEAWVNFERDTFWQISTQETKSDPDFYASAWVKAQIGARPRIGSHTPVFGVEVGFSLPQSTFRPRRELTVFAGLRI